ncbi:MAG: hypothetical protein MUF59_09455 [Candidatus Krumholzibacteria bacterium]|nr:hypothetical protein [Candidatus Krumholzibacteria bacterium]
MPAARKGEGVGREGRLGTAGNAFPGGEPEAFRPFFPGRESELPAGPAFRETLIERLALSPLPLLLLINLARQCRFEGLPLLEEAAARRDLDEGGAPARAVSGGVLPDMEEAFSILFGKLGEVREGQLEMARVVRRAFEEGRTALVEAGTGTGKSLGYLVPCVFHSMKTGGRIMISTHTRNLQDQLLSGELNNITAIPGIDVGVERLLGRENYICSRKAVSNVTRLSEEDPAGALSLALAVSLAPGGLAGAVSAHPGHPARKSLGAPPRCRMSACDMAQLCPLMNARKRARAAGIVFVNHALILTDYMQGNSILGPYQCVVFDEAHHLEDCVVENLSVSVSSGDVERLLEQVAPLSLADDRWKFLALELESAGNLKDPRGRIEKLSAAAAGLEASFEAFFDSVTALLNPGGGFRGVRTRYHDGAETFADARDHVVEIRYNINELRNTIKVILEAVEARQTSMILQDLSFIDEQAGIVSEAMEYLTGGSDEESVFWIEWSASGRAVAICGSPLRVDRRFADFLESSCESAVFTSATLAERGSFDFIKENLGIRLRPGQPLELISGSPFSYVENCLILLQNGLGDPNEAAFAAKAGEVVCALAMETPCRIMVLLTSYRMCRSMADFLSEKQVRKTLLVQDGTESREALAARFRASEGAMLLGVASFWEGVDFPGDQLEMLVIPKLPFPVPTEPVIEARSERLRRLGENPFTKLHIPLAVLRLRQGIGRLIRRSGDRGVVVILDSRLSSRAYGSIILSTLPVPVVETTSTGETVSRAAAWIGSGGGEPGGMKN